MTEQTDGETVDSIQHRFLEAYGIVRAKCGTSAFDETEALALVAQLDAYLSSVESKNIDKKARYALQQGGRRGAATILQREERLSEPARVTLREFIDRQPEFSGGRFRFTEDYSDNYISTWPQLFAELSGKQDIIFVEVGSFEGMSACWFLSNVLTHPSSKLICIDQFLESTEMDSPPPFDTYIDSEGRSLFERFLYNLRLTSAANRVVILKQSSHVALRNLPLGSVDAAYIDGSHHATDVIQDAILAWQVLKVRGLLIFDDYAWQSPFDSSPLSSPQPAIDSFVALFDGKVEVIPAAPQLVLRKLA